MYQIILVRKAVPGGDIRSKEVDLVGEIDLYQEEDLKQGTDLNHLEEILDLEIISLVENYLKIGNLSVV